MPKTRQLKVRGKSASIEDRGDLYAVMTKKDGPAAGKKGGGKQKTPSGLRMLDMDSIADLAPGIQQLAVEAFQDAGWVFVQSADPPEASMPVAKVFVKSGGRPVLGTNRLTVKVAETLTLTQAEELIARHGGQVVGRLKFAPGLYQVAVEPPPGQDILDVARALDAEESVEFAEPEFLEVLGGR